MGLLTAQAEADCMRSFPYVLLDVFTDEPLLGNPLAVFPDARGLDDRTMQRIARELNLSETTFVFAPVDARNAARVRIFTPLRELDFAGHPTIGTAWHLLGDDPSRASVVLEENAGVVPVRVERRANAGPMLWLTAPPTTFGRRVDATACAHALALEPRDLHPDAPPEYASAAGQRFLFTALRDRDAVDRARFDQRTLLDRAAPLEAEVFFVFAPLEESDGEPGDTYAVYSRMFAPDFGIIEDPATGAATGPLVAFMIRHGLLPNENGLRVVSEQGTAMGRRSVLHVLVHVNGESTQIEVGGSVVRIAEGTMTLPIRGEETAHADA